MRGLIVGLATILTACGGSSGFSTDPGSGTTTLLVDAHASFDNELNAADFNVNVKKAGANVDNAFVTITSEFGTVTLVNDPGKGDYKGTQAKWSDTGYKLDIVIKDPSGKTTDSLTAALEAPVRVVLTAPKNINAPFDPHTLPNQLLVVSWEGPPATSVHVKSKDFEPNLAGDPLTVSIPAAVFKDTTQKLEIDRSTGVALAGGLPGSRFTADYDFKTSLIVQNPF
jgi:hypothetical protein